MTAASSTDTLIMRAQGSSNQSAQNKSLAFPTPKKPKQAILRLEWETPLRGTVRSQDADRSHHRSYQLYRFPGATSLVAVGTHSPSLTTGNAQ